MTATVFAHVWDEAARAHTTRPFLLFRSANGDVDEWSYGEFDSVVGRVARYLKDAGATRGSSVHVALRNCPAFVALWLAAARLGVVLVPTDPASTSRDIAAHVRRVRPVLGICGASRSSVYRVGCADSVQSILELAEDASDLAAPSPLARDVDDLGVLTGQIAPEDLLAIMFTSGTTSDPKGVLLTQANYACVGTAMAAAAALEPEHRWFVALPLFHANAQYYCFAPAITVGASVALSASFSASGWIREARALDATHASLFAAPMRMILARTRDEEEPLALQHVWFAQNLGSDHYQRFSRLVGTRPRQLYGMTETLSPVCADTSDHPRADVIGTPLLGRRIKVEDGMLSVLGVPGVDLFLAYLDDPATTDRVFTATPEGTWFATGDRVAVDGEGVLSFQGRNDDMIKVAGENVSLTDIEAVVAQAPGVLEAVVLAQADPVRDVVPVAYFVATDPASPPTADELFDWAALNLAPAARPRAWTQVEDLPRTSVGKIRRFLAATAPRA